MDLPKTAAATGRAIESGALDAREVVREYLDRSAAHPESGRIYARLTERRALAEADAAAARARAGLRRHPLDGVPISWKDLFDSAGVATEAGSRLLAGRVPARDAAVLANASANGLVCLGKTHMTELAFSGLGLNPMTATPPNAIESYRTPGGSSSGAAVSAALGLAAAAIGSDTGGSVRVPAAWNNLVGLKTTHGSLPMGGVVPLCASFDTIGPLCHSVEDAALLWQAMGGAHVDLNDTALRGARLLVCEPALSDCEETIPAAFEACIARLAAAGAVVETAALPMLDEALALSGILFAPEAYAQWGALIEANPDAMFANVRERFRGGRDATASDYLRAWARLRALRAGWAAATAGYDAVLAPTAPILPPDAARLLAEPDYFNTRNLMTLRNTRIGNLMGGCSLTLPTGTDYCGLMVMAPPHCEAALLRLGTALEAGLME
ncbi:amidase [Abyssibius alkaniclasticus]|uniref:amidase n=1 Tax=Abyssibius alkaniclasticus TaxID=2881234 RepID=UPI004059E2B7